MAEGVEDTERGGREASCVVFKFEGTCPAVASTVGVSVLLCEGTEAAAGSRSGGWVEWMEGGAVLGPESS